MDQNVVEVGIEEEAAALEALALRLSWTARRRLAQELSAYGLTMPQYMTLRCVERSQLGCSMTELADASHQLTATMTGIVDRLTDRGLVARERDPNDRRALRVRLTPEGQAMMERLNANKHAMTVQLLSLMSAEERRLLMEIGQRYLVLAESSFSSSDEE
jgi:DNA-binding MarR family transcriptional regulator